MTTHIDLHLMRASNSLVITICHLSEAAETSERAQSILDRALTLQRELAETRDAVERDITAAHMKGHAKP